MYPEYVKIACKMLSFTNPAWLNKDLISFLDKINEKVLLGGGCWRLCSYEGIAIAIQTWISISPVSVKIYGKENE